MCWSLFFNKVTGLRTATFSKKKRLQRRCFPVNIAKFLEKHFYGTPPVTASDCPSSLFLRDAFTERNLGGNMKHTNKYFTINF